jgi:hypothetical protein
MAEDTKLKALLKDRKIAILGVLVCVFAVSLTYRLLHPFRQGRVSELTYAPGDAHAGVRKKVVQGAARPSQDRMVKLELFEHPPTPSGKVVRNPFFEPRAAPKPDKTKRNKAADAAKPVKTVPPIVAKREQVKKDLSRFKSFGYLDDGSDRVLFLERGKSILVVRKGDRIDGKYLVKEITEKRLTLRAQNIDEDVHIDLKGQ